jgi:hypothetical protein
MPRDNSPLIVGDYWLDKRRDGLSPDIWQIATYSGKSRSVVYRSTKRRTLELDAAKAALRAFEALQRSTERGQDIHEAELLPHLFNYLREHGPDVDRLDTVKSSFRAWIGFLMHDKQLDTSAVVADITPAVAVRFRRWRMGPHEWEVEWGGKLFSHKSEGVTGLTVQRNIEDLRSALNHGERERRFDAPAVPSVNKKFIVEEERPVPDIKTLGAVMGYAREDEGVFRELALMLGTSCRPGVALAFDPDAQWDGELIDLQPDGRPLTDKRNAIVPTIDPLRPILEGWKAAPHERVASRRTWWRTARRALGVDVEAYDFRHAVSTMMDDGGVPGAQISGITGHIPESRKIARTTSKHYLHYDPRTAHQAKRALTKFFVSVMREADKWAADHLRTKPAYKQPISIAKRLEDA